MCFSITSFGRRSVTTTISFTVLISGIDTMVSMHWNVRTATKYIRSSVIYKKKTSYGPPAAILIQNLHRDCLVLVLFIWFTSWKGKPHWLASITVIILSLNRTVSTIPLDFANNLSQTRTLNIILQHFANNLISTELTTTVARKCLSFRVEKALRFRNNYVH